LAEELKLNAQRELSKVKDEMKFHDIMEEIRDKDLYSHLSETSLRALRNRNTGKIEDYSNYKFEFPKKPAHMNIYSLESNETEGGELRSQINYLPIRETNDAYKSIKGGTASFDAILKREKAKELEKERFDYAKIQFEAMFPDHMFFNTDNKYYKEAKVDQYLRATELDLLKSERPKFDEILVKNDRRLKALDDIQNPEDEIKKYDKMLGEYLRRGTEGEGGI